MHGNSNIRNKFHCSRFLLVNLLTDTFVYLVGLHTEFLSLTWFLLSFWVICVIPFFFQVSIILLYLCNSRCSSSASHICLVLLIFLSVSPLALLKRYEKDVGYILGCGWMQLVPVSPWFFVLSKTRWISWPAERIYCTAWSVSRQVRSLLQTEFSTECDLVLPFSNSSIFFLS